MKPAEIRPKESKEIVKLVDEKREALFGFKLRLKAGQLAKTANIRNLKRDIARLNTILAEKRIGEKDGKRTGKKG